MDLFNKSAKETQKELVLEVPPKSEGFAKEKLVGNKVEVGFEHFGQMQALISKRDITDIEYNGRNLWVTDIYGIHKKVEDIELSENFVYQFTQRIANAVSKDFNKTAPVLEAEAIVDTKEERISIRIEVIHEDKAVTGRAFCIRKTPSYARITEEGAIAEGYMTPKELVFLKNCIKAHMNIMICGEPGVGKTELAKFLSLYIPGDEKVITIEDNLEWHYKDLKPDSDCIELQVGENFNYVDAIKTCMRMSPKWMMTSEVRGSESEDYMQALSTGVTGIATIHTESALKIPGRLLNMARDRSALERMELDINSFLNIGINVRKVMTKEGNIKRMISEIVAFSEDGNASMVFLNGKLKVAELPESIREKFARFGVSNAFSDEQEWEG